MTTSNHQARFKNRDGNPFPYDADLDITPIRWSGSDQGGPKEATITISGPRSMLKSILSSWLRYEVEITTENLTTAWWGYIHTITLEIDGLAITSSLDNLRNRIAVTYSSLEGTIEQGITSAWIEDAGSIADFGIKEHFESLGSATTLMATTLQTTMLNQMARPRLKRSIGSPGTSLITLECKGWIETTSWLYYQRTAGRIEHFSNRSELQPIGWGITADDKIGFGGYGIHDELGRFSHIQPGMEIIVSGSASNNTVYPIADTAETDEPWTFASNTIWFEPSDDMHETWGNMVGLKSATWVEVSGSLNNSRWHYISSAGADHTKFSSSVSGTIIGESVGQNISLLQCQKLPATIRGAFEAPGVSSSVNLTLQGNKVAQRVYCTTAMTISSVYLEVAKVGSPSDSLRVSIYSDSGGSVGSLLSTGSLAASGLSGDSAGAWIPITQMTLFGGIYYWVVVDRTGSDNGVNHYLVSMTKDTTLSCKMWTGTSWTDHKPGWFLKYRLWATEDTGTIIETMLSARPQFITIAPGYLSGVRGYITMDQLMIVEDELLRLISIGTSSGNRIQLEITPDKILRMKTQPSTPQPETVLRLSTSDKLELTDSVGSLWPKGLLPYGLYVSLVDLDVELQQGLSPTLIQEVEYDAVEDSWTISFGGERSLSDILRVQQG